MSKIKYDAKLKSNEDNLHIFGTGIKAGNKISYKENDIKVTLYLYPDRIDMERESSEYKVKLAFKLNDKGLSIYKLKGHDEFLLDVDTKELIISDNYIKIDYTLEGNEFSYILSLEDLW